MQVLVSIRPLQLKLLPSSLHSDISDRISPPPNNKMFIFGMGYVGTSFARHLQEQNWDVSGTCASEERRVALDRSGFRAFHFNSEEDRQLNDEGMIELGDATHITSTIPPVTALCKDPVLSTYRQYLEHLAVSANLQWIGYLSSTGIYGDHQGAWVDENTPPKPINPQGLARLEAEKEWLQLGFKTGTCVQVFRLGGIYGPGRSAIDTLLKSSKLSMKQRHRETRQYTSRVHVTDVCRVLRASIQSPTPGRVYNVVDDDPASRAEVFSHARILINEKWPFKLEYMDGEHRTSGLRVTEKSEKRVSNKRLKEELQIQLLYPNYKCGLKAIIDELDDTSRS